MKKFEKLLSKPWAAYTFASCCAVLLYMVLSHFGAIKTAASSVWSFISPVVIGIVIAYLLNPVSDFFEKKLFKNLKKEGSRHGWAVVVTLLCFVLFLNN